MSNNQKRNFYRPSSGGTRNFQLVPGMRGFFGTCNFHERECVQEAMNLLNEYADAMVGHENWRETSKSVDNTQGHDEPEIADTLQKELQDLQSKSGHVTCSKRFRVINSGVKSCIFIQSSIPEPVPLVVKMLTDIQESKQTRSRFLLRLLPIEVTCRMHLPDITAAASKLFDKYFAEGNKSFAIIYRRHNNTGISRDVLIEVFVEMIMLKNASNHVDLTKPELAVLVEIVRSICCISVVPNYYQLARYNLQEVASAPPKDASEKSLEDGCSSSQSPSHITQDTKMTENSPTKMPPNDVGMADNSPISKNPKMSVETSSSDQMDTSVSLNVADEK